MRVVFANDGARLARQLLLQELECVQIPELSAKQEQTFIEAFDGLGPVVLFWHEYVEAALGLLARLDQTSRWPSNLAGVVLFGAAPYAGLGTKDAAAKQLRQFRLSPATVNILSLVVSDYPTRRTIGAVLRFGRAIRGQETSVLPYWMLAPTDVEEGVFTLLVLDLLIGVNREDLSRVLHKVDWKRVSNDCARYHVRLPGSASIKAIQSAADAVRRSSQLAAEVRCRGCGPLKVLEHRRLKWEIPPDEPLRGAALRALCSDALGLAGQAQSLVTVAAKDVGSRLTMTNADLLLPPLLTLLATSYSRQCRLFMSRGTLPVFLSNAISALLVCADTAPSISELSGNLKCTAEELVEISL